MLVDEGDLFGLAKSTFASVAALLQSWIVLTQELLPLLENNLLRQGATGIEDGGVDFSIPLTQQNSAVTT